MDSITVFAASRQTPLAPNHISNEVISVSERLTTGSPTVLKGLRSQPQENVSFLDVGYEKPFFHYNPALVMRRLSELLL